MTGNVSNLTNTATFNVAQPWWWGSQQQGRPCQARQPLP